MVVKNLGNLLNGEFGDYRRSSTLNKLASASWDADGNISYSGYKSPNTDQLIGTASIWNIKLGFNYSF